MEKKDAVMLCGVVMCVCVCVGLLLLCGLATDAALLLEAGVTATTGVAFHQLPFSSLEISAPKE